MDLFQSLERDGICVACVRICDIIKLDFSVKEETICLHIQSALTRILKDNELLVSSNDMFVPGKNHKKSFFKKFKWDIPGNSLFDDCLDKINDDLLNKKILNVQFIGRDLIINFDSGISIQVLCYTLEQDREVFRIFMKGDLNSHIVIDT